METVKSHPIFNLKAAFHFHSDVETKQLRSFGLIFFCFFTLILGLSPAVFGNSPIKLWAVYTGLLFLTLALTAPKALKVPYQAWMVFGGILGFINTRIILALVFFLIFTPIAFFKRLFRKDTLGFQFKRPVSTYRTDLKNKKHTSMNRQF